MSNWPWITKSSSAGSLLGNLMEIQRPQQPFPISISLDLDSFGQVSVNKWSRIEQNRNDILDCIRFSTIFNLTQQIHYTKLLTLKSVAGGRVVSALDCYAEGSLFKSDILPLLKHAYGEQQPATIDLLAIKMVGSCHTRGEAQGISCMPPPSVDKAAHSGGFEIQRRHHQKSKTEVSVAPQKDMCPPKLKRKKLLTLEISKVGGWIVWTNFINDQF